MPDLQGSGRPAPEPDGPEKVTLCALLWAHPGRADELVAYEDEVLAFLPDHGGRILQRVRTTGAVGDDPLEVQLLEFQSEAAFYAFMNDDRRLALADRRGQAVARTQVLRVEPT